MLSKLFRCITEKGETGSTVYLSGEIDYAASLELVPWLDDLVTECEGHLLFDLAGVTLIDSEGIKMLMEAADRIRDKRLSARVIRTSAAADRIMRMAGVSEFLEIGGPDGASWTESLARQFFDARRIPHA